MPQRNGRGPFGTSAAGRGAGGCTGNQGSWNWGRGRRHHRGGGMGIGRIDSMPIDDARAFLEQRKSWLEQQLEWITSRLKSLDEPK